jgi:diguanylate cyclase (GGDEF)-like protein
MAEATLNEMTKYPLCRVPSAREGAAPLDGTAPLEGAVPPDRAAPLDGTVPLDGGVSLDRAAPARELAAAWAAALADARADMGHVPLSQAESADFLVALALVLLRTVRESPFHPERAVAVGTALVDANFVAAETLGRSLGILAARLPSAVGGVAPEDLRARLSAVQEAVATGYVRALRDRTVAEQEAIRRAEIEVQRNLREHLRHLATHDPLTGLPNRTLFFSRLTAALATDACVGVCYLDLDGFKAINDTHGHDAGDQLLAGIARRLDRVLSASRELDGLVARMGGDEFVLLVERSPGVDGLVSLVAAMLTELQRPFCLGTRQVSVTASIGIVERPATADTVMGSAAEIVKHADATLYSAKSAGPGHWAVYDPAVMDVSNE